MFRSGYVAVLGRANAGKSSLVNSFVGEKVAVVTDKPQTTRENILGILSDKDYQIVFVDTPGIHHSKNSLDKKMMKSVRSAIAGVDLVLYLLDGTKSPDEEEIDYINHLENDKIVVKTKIDLKGQKDFDYDIKVSSVTGENLDELKNLILSKLPEYDFQNYIYDPEYYTDKSVKFLVAEDIREKALLLLHQEIPHGVAVDITKFDEKDDIVYIDADIICEQDRHKGMIIGKGGSMLKQIGSLAREDAEKLLGKKVGLKLFVRVEKNWRDNPNKIRSLGY